MVAIIDPSRFVQSTRDAGYRHLASALAELVDNALQAGATEIDIFLPDARCADQPAAIAVRDNGTGMDRETLRTALQFGGSRRFNSRYGLGRFGMGLPNSSLSQARRVEVYSWQDPDHVLVSRLDIDEVIATTEPRLAEPELGLCPPPFSPLSPTGTLIVWRKLDRDLPANWKVAVRRLEMRLGRMFRDFLGKGHTLRVNDRPVAPHDPLFLAASPHLPDVSAQLYGTPLTYPVHHEGGQSVIEVRFTELPVEALATLPNANKRQAGITNGAGVSIVRAGREIDYGWFFLDKRRENYDDWWRCEIRFEPALDELFGVTQIKQGIRPTEALRQIMTDELSAIARTLNRRVRLAHQALAARQSEGRSARVATRQDLLLKPLPPAPAATPLPGQVAYRLAVDQIDAHAFLRSEIKDGQLAVTLNSLHEFYLNIFQPVAQGDSAAPGHRAQLELMLLALGRTIQLDWDAHERQAIDRFIHDWSRAISVFCRSGQ